MLHEKFNINKRIKLRELADNHIAIEKKIKSRIIQKDAKKIIEQAKQIRRVIPNCQVSLICTANICSKSVALLQQEKIQLSIEEL